MFGLFSILKSKKIITLSNDYQESIPLHKYFNKKIYEIPPYISISAMVLIQRQITLELPLVI